MDLHTTGYWCARFVSLLSLLVALAGIGGRTSLSSFPMGTIPHGIYNNNGHMSVGDGSIFIYPFVFRFLLHRHRRSFCFIVLSFFYLFFLPPVFLRSFLSSVSTIFLAILRIYAHYFRPRDTADFYYSTCLLLDFYFPCEYFFTFLFDYIIHFISNVK